MELLDIGFRMMSKELGSNWEESSLGAVSSAGCQDKLSRYNLF